MDGDQDHENITNNNENIAACRCLEKRSLPGYFAPFDKKSAHTMSVESLHQTLLLKKSNVDKC